MQKSAIENLKSKIITALAYPAVLALSSVGVLAYFIVYIVPVFAGIFKDFNLQLPFITQVIVTISNVFGKYFAILILAAIGAGMSFRGYISTSVGLLTWNHIQFRLPLFGNLIKNMQTERMLTTMSTLIRSGVSILNAVSVLEGAFRKNLIYQNALKQAKNDIASGRSISESFKRTGIFPGMVTEMISINVTG